MAIKRDKMKVYDMTCTSCENRIEKAIKKLPGVISAEASFSDEEVFVEYDTNGCNLDKIKFAVTGAGYSTKSSNIDKIIGILIIAVVVIFLSTYSGGIDMNERLNGNTTYFVLIVVGLFTSIHCVGMCGGIMLSQTLSQESGSKITSLKTLLIYNAGRVLSYTMLGGVVGALGSVLSISLSVKAGIMIFAGLFMIIMGLNMYGFSWFRKIHIKLPWSSHGVRNKAKAPYIIGLLNGFMPCGPLQTMQLYALGSGSALNGALSMFIFSLGTVPLMLFFGAVAGFLSKGYSKKILKFSGILIITLGLIMSNRGLALSGINLNPLDVLKSQTIDSDIPSAAKAEIQGGVQVVKISATYYGYEPKTIFIQKGVPVKWIIDGKQITSCNNEIIIPSMNIKKTIKKGENIVEFTPKGGQDINFSCWMGMLKGTIKVVDNLSTIDPSKTGVDISSSEETPAPAKMKSIYSDDISKVPTSRIVKKASISDNSQSIYVTGIGMEFEPVIIVLNKNMTAKITFDFNGLDIAEGQFSIISGRTNKTVTTFDGKKDVFEFQYNFKESGTYGIVKDNRLISVIEVLDTIINVDFERIRKKYIKQ